MVVVDWGTSTAAVPSSLQGLQMLACAKNLWSSPPVLEKASLRVSSLVTPSGSVLVLSLNTDVPLLKCLERLFLHLKAFYISYIRNNILPVLRSCLLLSHNNKLFAVMHLFRSAAWGSAAFSKAPLKPAEHLSPSRPSLVVSVQRENRVNDDVGPSVVVCGGNNNKILWGGAGWLQSGLSTRWRRFVAWTAASGAQLWTNGFGQFPSETPLCYGRFTKLWSKPRSPFAPVRETERSICFLAANKSCQYWANLEERERLTSLLHHVLIVAFCYLCTCSAAEKQEMNAASERAGDGG